MSMRSPMLYSENFIRSIFKDILCSVIHVENFNTKTEEINEKSRVCQNCVIEAFIKVRRILLFDNFWLRVVIALPAMSYSSVPN